MKMMFFRIYLLQLMFVPSLGMLCLMNMIFFSLPSFDEQIYYDVSIPPIYDGYIDESGFGRVLSGGRCDICQRVAYHCGSQ